MAPSAVKLCNNFVLTATALCRIICSKAVTAYYERRKRNKYGESVTVGRSVNTSWWHILNHVGGFTHETCNGQCEWFNLSLSPMLTLHHCGVSGLAGTIYFLADMLDPANAKFPAFEL